MSAAWSDDWAALGRCSTKRETAAVLAALGLHVHVLHGLTDGGLCTCGRPTCNGDGTKPPSNSRGKHPIDNGWTTAPFDPARVDALLVSDPRLNIGLRAGMQPRGCNLGILDVDGRSQQLVNKLLELGARAGAVFPRTLSQLTGKGQHVIYDTGDVVFPNTVRIHALTVGEEGVDLRGQRGQIVLSPSTHHSGSTYRWQDLCAPALLPRALALEIVRVTQGARPEIETVALSDAHLEAAELFAKYLKVGNRYHMHRAFSGFARMPGVKREDVVEIMVAAAEIQEPGNGMRERREDAVQRALDPTNEEGKAEGGPRLEALIGDDGPAVVARLKELLRPSPALSKELLADFAKELRKRRVDRVKQLGHTIEGLCKRDTIKADDVLPLADALGHRFSEYDAASIANLLAKNSEPTKEKIAERVAHAQKFSREKRSREKLEKAKDKRPVIVESPELHKNVEEAIAALKAATNLYQRGAVLVTIVIASDLDAAEKEKLAIVAGTPIIREVTVPMLRERLTRVARFLKLDTNSGSHIPARPSSELVQAVLAAGSWPVPVLVGITEAPTLRPDGTILDQPGWDATTGFVYMPTAAFPPVPENPTFEDAQRALARLAEPFLDFPYKRLGEDVHKYSTPGLWATVATLLAIIVRPAIKGAVLSTGFDGNVPGAGKSRQADVICVIATGRPAAMMAWPERPEELEKVLGSYALQGTRIIVFDNVPVGVAYAGAPLERAISATDEVQLRVLGKSEVPTHSWRSVVLATGNHLLVTGDMKRRTLLVQIETPLESPEKRDPKDFLHPDLLGWCAVNRAQLVVDALTIVRAHVVAGRPMCGLTRLGGFEQWTEFVAAPIKWASGGAEDENEGVNVLDAHATGLADDPEKDALATILSEWRRLAPDGMTLKVALGKLYTEPTSGLTYSASTGFKSVPKQNDGFDDLRSALESVAPPQPGKPLSETRLGVKFRGFKNKRVNGLYLTADGSHAGSARWVVRTEGTGAEPWRAQASGPSFSPSMRTYSPPPPKVSPERAAEWAALTEQERSDAALVAQAIHDAGGAMGEARAYQFMHAAGLHGIRIVAVEHHLERGFPLPNGAFGYVTLGRDGSAVWRLRYEGAAPVMTPPGGGGGGGG